MVSNQIEAMGHAGFRDTYRAMEAAGELAAFGYLTPRATTAARGQDASLRELMEEGRLFRPDVLLVATANGFGHSPAWVRNLIESARKPTVIYWEGDPWHRWAKPVNRSMASWLAVADVVFTSARRPHVSLFRRAGASDVRFLPQTYCHVMFSHAEQWEPPAMTSPQYDAVMVGGRLAHLGGLSRIPGASGRARLVRMLQRDRDLRLAVYGHGWSGPGAMGVLPFAEQVRAIRESLTSCIWDHFPRHESYASNRLAISMVAGRPHVTTAHDNFDWITSPRDGLFVERSVSAVARRVHELAQASPSDLLALGRRAHQWARERLSDRMSARFMLGAVNEDFLRGLPEEPWLRLASEWPK